MIPSLRNNMMMGNIGSGGVSPVYKIDLGGGSYIIAAKERGESGWAELEGQDYYVVKDTTDLKSIVAQYIDLPNQTSNHSQGVAISRDGVTKTIPLNDVVTTNVTDMLDMFRDASNFNQSISSWDTSNVTSMYRMFMDCTRFNQPLNFDTSKVTHMGSLFRNCYVFNQPLNFDTSKATNMSYMFSNSRAFNHPLEFDTSNATNMTFMFFNAYAFNQDLSEWCVQKIPSKPSNFDTSTSSWVKSNRQPRWGQAC